MKLYYLLFISLSIVATLNCTGTTVSPKEKTNDTPIEVQGGDPVDNKDQSPIELEKAQVATTIENTKLESDELDSEVFGTVAWKLNEPDQVFDLSLPLKEISGLTFDRDQQTLLAINDEIGRIYRIDPMSGKELSDEKFGKKGDYEGIQKVGDDIYVLKSNGHIYRRDTLRKDGNELIRTDLRAANDAEGLGYDPQTGHLLLACKGKTNISSDQNIKKSKVVYGLNLTSRILTKDPYLIITDQELEEYVTDHYSAASSNGEYLKDLLKRAKSFAPSGLAYRESTDQFYIISSVGKLLVVLNREKEVVAVEFLDKSVHVQPEGICFDDQDRLYISNEGKFGIAKIYRYDS